MSAQLKMEKRGKQPALSGLHRTTDLGEQDQSVDTLPLLRNNGFLMEKKQIQQTRGYT
jgi:hypothetical protein